MNQRLTQAQLKQVVAEVERLSQQRDTELDSEQVKQILQELSLPPELLDEALVQLQRREALVNQTRRNQWIVMGIGLALTTILVAGFLSFQQSQQRLAQVSVLDQSHISLTQAGSDTITEVSRSSGAQLFYRVTLSNAPAGESLKLRCDWINPTGQVMHQNQWQTKTIDKPVWPTYCRYQLPQNAPVGTWTVRLSLGDRVLSTTAFQVR